MGDAEVIDAAVDEYEALLTDKVVPLARLTVPLPREPPVDLSVPADTVMGPLRPSPAPLPTLRRAGGERTNDSRPH